MRYARINNDKVTEVIDYDPVGKYPEEWVWVEVPAGLPESFPIIFKGGVLTSAIEDDEFLWGLIRHCRGLALLDSDGRELDEGSLWATYRQKLRDIPQDFSNPKLVMFPLAPGDEDINTRLFYEGIAPPVA